MTPSLKPKKVDFEEKWQAILRTVESVINCRMVERDTWSVSFQYPFYFYLKGKAIDRS